jgi:hypothetical protein
VFLFFSLSLHIVGPHLFRPCPLKINKQLERRKKAQRRAQKTQRKKTD